MTSPVTCYLSLGSNLSDRARNIKDARRRLAEVPEIEIDSTSSVYESAPVGPQDQSDFLNQVAEVQVICSARRLLSIVQGIEKEIGRVRAQHWGPRSIDIDILLYGDETVDEPDLKIPHPQILHRQFVLVPLAEIAPDLVLPDGRTAAEAARPADPTLRRVGE